MSDNPTNAERALRLIADRSTHTNHKYEVCGACVAEIALGRRDRTPYDVLPKRIPKVAEGNRG